MSYIIFAATFYLVFAVAKRTGRSPWLHIFSAAWTSIILLVVVGLGVDSNNGVFLFLVAPTLYAVALFLIPVEKVTPNA